MQKNQGGAEQACTKLHNEISYADLPLSCPPRDDRVWDAHPRVYLPIEEVGRVVCPYCGTEYVLKNWIG
ncbi:MAG: zinc-finger domain-containing protein [Gammaproteobacteria bacterium]|nr:zinc-finger domain-containing protein [Gammaproteobacteria bacterium]MCW5582343.1 zinc-finger domain-containing protein [Gammaproteobacteria bacterium]